MILKDFKLTDYNHFIAFEQRGIFSKSIYLVITTNDILIGLELNNKISLENLPHLGMLFPYIMNSEQRGDKNNPYSYIKKIELTKIEKKELFGKDILSVNKNNFRIDKVHINELVFIGISTTKFANSGDILIETKTETKKHPNPTLQIPKRKFTLLGIQDYAKIVTYFNTSHL